MSVPPYRELANGASHSRRASVQSPSGSLNGSLNGRAPFDYPFGAFNRTTSRGNTSVAKYKHLTIKKVNLADYAAPARERQLTPRQRAQLERDEELKAAFNEAATLPASEAVAIELRPDQKLPTMRAAIKRLIAAEPRDLRWGVRDRTILISKGAIPGGRGRRPS